MTNRLRTRRMSLNDSGKCADDGVGDLGGSVGWVGPLPQFDVAVIIDEGVYLASPGVVKRGGQVRSRRGVMQSDAKASSGELGRNGPQPVQSDLVVAGHRSAHIRAPGVRATPAYMSAGAGSAPTAGRHSVSGTIPGGTSGSPANREVT